MPSVSTPAGKLLLLFGTTIKYLLRDEFNVDEAAPLTSPRTALPGPGTETITDSANLLSISGGALISNGTGTGANDPSIVSGFARAAGRAFLTSGTGGNGSARCGWGATNNLTTITHGVLVKTNGNKLATPAVNLADTSLATAGNVMAFILRDTGAFYYLNGNLGWVDTFTTTSPMYAGWAAGASGAARFPATVDYYRIRDLNGPFTTDYGIATLHIASPVNGSSYTGDADAIIDLTIANVTALSICGFKYRVLDTQNYWIVYIDAAGHFKVDSVVANVLTNRVDVAGVAAIGGTYTLRVICDGTKHNFYTLSATSWSKRGAEIDIGATPQDTTPTIIPVIGANWTPTNLDDYPRRSALYNQLSAI